MAVVICGAAAGVPADRARVHPEAQPDAAGDAMARAGAADLLRAVPGAADPDAGQGRSFQRAGRGCRRRAAALGAADVAVVPRRCGRCWRDARSTARPSPRSSRAPPAGRPMWRWRSPAISMATPGWRWLRWRWSRSSRWSTCSALRCSRNTPPPEKQSVRAIVMTVVRNPLIWACAIGLALNVTAPAAAAHLARGRRRARPLLARRSACSSPAPACSSPACFARAWPPVVAVFLKLILMPVFAHRAGALVRHIRFQSRDRGGLFGGAGSSSAYVLARQMGGDAPLLAQIITLQTILAAITMPIVIALVQCSLSASQMLCSVAARLFRPCRTTVSQVEPVR